MARNNEITFNIVKQYGVLSESEYDRTNWKTKVKEHIHETKEVNLVSWNGGTPKLEIRSWSETNNVKTPGKGVTLSDEELSNFRFLLEEIDSDAETEAV